MSRLCLTLFLCMISALLLGQEMPGNADSVVQDTAPDYAEEWSHLPFYRDSLVNDSQLQSLFPFQSSYNPAWASRSEKLGDPVWRTHPSNTWRYLVILGLMTCVGLARLLSPGVILTYFRSFFKPKLLGEVLEDQNSEISGFSILMSFFTALMYALPFQWLLSISGHSMTDYPLGDYILLGLLIFSFIILRFMVSSLLGRVFEARYFVATSIYSSVFLNFFAATISIPVFLLMLLNSWVPDESTIGLLLLVLLGSVALIKNLRSLMHAASRFAYPSFYLILYLCTLELGPWSWVYIFLDY